MALPTPLSLTLWVVVEQAASRRRSPSPRTTARCLHLFAPSLALCYTSVLATALGMQCVRERARIPYSTQDDQALSATVCHFLWPRAILPLWNIYGHHGV